MKIKSLLENVVEYIVQYLEDKDTSYKNISLNEYIVIDKSSSFNISFNTNGGDIRKLDIYLRVDRKDYTISMTDSPIKTGGYTTIPKLEDLHSYCHKTKNSHPLCMQIISVKLRNEISDSRFEDILKPLSNIFFRGGDELIKYFEERNKRCRTNAFRNRTRYYTNPYNLKESDIQYWNVKLL